MAIDCETVMGTVFAKGGYDHIGYCATTRIYWTWIELSRRARAGHMCAGCVTSGEPPARPTGTPPCG